jgi:hypothetical protein
VATYKAGNYFRFPEIETPPAATVIAVMQQDEEEEEQEAAVSTDVPTTTHRRTFESLTIGGGSVGSDKESIILKIDEVETPAEEKSFGINKGDDETGV